MGIETPKDEMRKLSSYRAERGFVEFLVFLEILGGVLGGVLLIKTGFIYYGVTAILGAIISGSLIYCLGGALFDICDSLLYTRTHLKMESIRREFRPTDT